MRIIITLFFIFNFSNLFAHEDKDLFFLNCKGIFPYELAGGLDGLTEERILKVDLKRKNIILDSSTTYKIDTESLNNDNFTHLYGLRETKYGNVYGYGGGIFIETIIINRFDGIAIFSYRNKKTEKFYISSLFKLNCKKIDRGF